MFWVRLPSSTKSEGQSASINSALLTTRPCADTNSCRGLEDLRRQHDSLRTLHNHMLLAVQHERSESKRKRHGRPLEKSFRAILDRDLPINLETLMTSSQPLHASLCFSHPRRGPDLMRLLTTT